MSLVDAAPHHQTDPGIIGGSSGVPIPRWEWRSFDYQPQRWQDVLGAGARTGAGSLRSETYLLTRGAPCNVKVRDARVEVKRLLATRDDGLELWQPVLKTGFPMAPDVVATLCDAWDLVAHEPAEPLPTVEHLFSFLARELPSVMVVPVRTWSRAYQIHGCMAERATVLVRGALLETLALEHEDPGILHAALRAHRLDREPNTNYVLALKRLLGWHGEATHSPRATPHPSPHGAP